MGKKKKKPHCLFIREQNIYTVLLSKWTFKWPAQKKSPISNLTMKSPPTKDHWGTGCVKLEVTQNPSQTHGRPRGLLGDALYPASRPGRLRGTAALPSAQVAFIPMASLKINKYTSGVDGEQCYLTRLSFGSSKRYKFTIPCMNGGGYLFRSETRHS